jgi:hypothetical protein
MQAATTISWPFTCSCTVSGVLASPLHIPVWASTRSMLSRGPNFELTKYFVSRSQQLTTNECESVEITNKMQPCNRIYYFKLYLQLLVYIHMLWPAVVKIDSLELLMMSGMPLETCWAFNKLWNNKSHYKVASCWLFLLIPARIRER